MTYDYIILGGGLAGTILQDFLSKEASVLIIDSEAGQYGSKVAAGIYNPVTGRRMVKSWLVDILAPFAQGYYAEKEALLGERFVQSLHIKRLFHNEQQRSEWLKKVDFYGIENIIAGELAPDASDARIVRDHGGVETKASWRLNTRAFLEAMHGHLKEHDALLKQQITYESIAYEDGEVRVGLHKARHVIFCEGWRMAENPWFQHLTLVPNKGELLTIEAPDLEEKDLLQKGMFVLPLGGGHYKIGATYNKEKVDYEPTETAKSWLLERLERTIKTPYQILKHEVGVRPTSKDRRPMLGRHFKLDRFSVFNGFGSKGVSQIPWCAQQMKEHLIDDKPLHRDIDIKRFMDVSDQ